MSPSITTKLRHWWNIRQNAKKTLSSSKTEKLLSQGKLLGRRPMDNTPFEIVGEEKKGYFAALGKYRITEPYKTEADVEEYINKNIYNIMLIVMQILIPNVVKDELNTRAEERLPFSETIEQDLNKKN